MSKPLIEAGYRNPLEEKVAQQLEAAGVEFDYEGLVLPVAIPARTAKAKPDFPCTRSNIIIETKGHFGGSKGRDKASADARAKLLLMKAQHPELDIRFVFQNSKTKIYKGSKTTNGDWATDHGFQWSDRGIVPQEWIKEIKAQQRGTNGRANPRNQSVANAAVPVNAASRGRHRRNKPRRAGSTKRPHQRTAASRLRHRNPARTAHRV